MVVCVDAIMMSIAITNNVFIVKIIKKIIQIWILVMNGGQR